MNSWYAASGRSGEPTPRPTRMVRKGKREPLRSQPVLGSTCWPRRSIPWSVRYWMRCGVRRLALATRPNAHSTKVPSSTMLEGSGVGLYVKVAVGCPPNP
jgi:hypothetical protein